MMLYLRLYEVVVTILGDITHPPAHGLHATTGMYTDHVYGPAPQT